MTGDIQLPKKRTPDEPVQDVMTKNAVENIFPARYQRRDESGAISESVEDVFARVAENVAQAELEYGASEDEMNRVADEFFDMMTSLEFMPNSPTLMNAGTELQQLSACFVLSPEDDLSHIYETVKDAALIHKSGGGTGYAFHQLRPKGAIVSSTGGVSSGPVSFMKSFDTACGTIAQGGKRRGAQMAIMKIDHPDVLRFATAKRREGDFSNFNISVGVTDEFYESVKSDSLYTLYDTDGEPFELVEETVQFYSSRNEHAKADTAVVDSNFWRDFADDINFTGDRYKYRKFFEGLEVGEEFKLPAAFVWDVLIDGAWRNGEPGLFMYDRVNKEHSFDVEKFPEHRMEASNPCQEQPLENFEACNLGHINLSLFASRDASLWPDSEMKRAVDQDDASLSEAMSRYMKEAIDWSRLIPTVEYGVRFLDNVVTMSDFPLDEIDEKVRSNRKIGLGIMGWAQLLVQLGIPYGSSESVVLAEKLMVEINRESKIYSRELAKTRGVFDNWDKSKWADPTEYSEFFARHTGQDPALHEDGYELRNHQTVTIAPTGTTSMIANTSGGCEPIFNVAHYKNVSNDVQGADMLVEFDDYFLRVLEANGIDPEPVKEQAKQLMEENRYEGPESLPIPIEIAELFVTADMVSPLEHVQMQAAFQKGVDSSISKTCNLPNDATRDDIDSIYHEAVWRGCKGITVYRDGSRDEQVLTTRQDNKIDEDEEDDAAPLFESEEMTFDTSDDDPVIVDAMSGSFTLMSDDYEVYPRDRPGQLDGETHRISTGYGKVYVTINRDEHGKPFELFATIGNSGGFVASFTEALAKSTSLALRSGVVVDEVIETLEGVRSPKVGWDNGEQIDSIPDALATALQRSIGERPADSTETVTPEATTDGSGEEVCPDCGDHLAMTGGCAHCQSCGYEAC